MGRPLHLHAGVVDEDVHTAEAVQDFLCHILDTADVGEIQEDQLGGECLLDQCMSQGMCSQFPPVDLRDLPTKSHPI